MYCNAILFATLAVASTVNALATPVHGVRSLHRHSSIAKARAPAPAPEPAAAVIASPFVSKRGLKKRCKPRASPTSLTPSSSSSAAVLPSGVGNVGADPNSSTAAPAEPSTKAPAPAPSSSAAAPPPPPPPPKPTTSAAPPPPKPTTSAAPPPPKPTTSAAPPPPAPTSGGGSGGNCDDLFATGCTRTGQGTFYNTGLTSCGIQNSDTDFIAAVSEKLYDQFEVDGNPNHDKLCGRKAEVTFGGKTITVTITDRCTACQLFDLDFTPTAFQALGIDLGVGRVSGVQWKFIS